MALILFNTNIFIEMLNGVPKATAELASERPSRSRPARLHWRAFSRRPEKGRD